jgi:hypothetical protein
MRSLLQTKRGTEILPVITLFCYSVSLLALFILAQSLVTLALNVASLQIVAIYSTHGI